MRVLVTRPEQSGLRTAERLTELGFQPILLPLTRTEPLPVATAADPAAIERIAVTSANALRHAPPDLLAALRDVPCFTVGQETANAAMRRGFSNVTAADGDAATLATALSKDPGMRILYLCGRLRRPIFENLLREAGVIVTPVETYDTLAIDYTPAQLAAQIGSQPVQCVLVYSAEAAIALLRLLRSATPRAIHRETIFLGISRRVTAVLAGQHLKTQAATEPTEPALLSALRDISARS